MVLISFIRRRIFPKVGPIIKKVVIPVGVIFMLVNLLSKNGKIPTRNPTTLVVPGEALDPLAPKLKRSHSHSSNSLNQIDLDSASKDGVLYNKSALNNVKKKTTQKPKKEEPKEGYVKEDLQRLPTSWSLYSANIKNNEKVRSRGHAISKDTVSLTLMSSSDKVFMSINKREIYRALNDSGIHLVVLSQYTGRVMATKVFDTQNEGSESELIQFIDSISKGRIMIFAVRGEVAKGLTWRGRNVIRDLGSRWITKLESRDMWALVGRHGGMKLAETYSNVATEDTGYEWGGPVFLRTDFDLEENTNSCNWTKNEQNEERTKFCARYEGYKRLCDCNIKDWDQIFFPTDKNLTKELEKDPMYDDLGIAILSSNRPHYLYKTLRFLWEAHGVNRKRVSIFCENPNRELVNLIKLFGIPLITTLNYNNKTTVGSKIRHKMQRIFRDMMGAKFPSSSIPEGNLPPVSSNFSCKHILILEDDLKISTDLFKYLYSVSPVLSMDKSILGITSYNYHGQRLVASSLTSFYRTSSTNIIGLLLPARTVHDLLVPNWPEANKDANWRETLENLLISDPDHAIIFPEVPRVLHFGYRGFLIAGSIQFKYFDENIISLSSKYTVDKDDLEKLTLPRYDEDLKHMIKETDPMTYDICKHPGLIYGHEPFVVYVKEGEDAWSTLMECLNTWSVYYVNGWKKSWRFTYYGHPLIVISFPDSPFSDPKHDGYVHVKQDQTTTTTTPTTTTTTSTTTITSSAKSTKSTTSPTPN